MGNVPGTHFCRDCGSPLSSHAAFGPFEHLFAEGHIYRRATEQPQKLIVVAGIWLIFGPMALSSAFLSFSEWQQGSRFGPGLMVLLLPISLILIIKSTANYIARKRIKRKSNGALGP
jgi:hypothetical protein